MKRSAKFKLPIGTTSRSPDGSDLTCHFGTNIFPRLYIKTDFVPKTNRSMIFFEFVLRHY